MGMLDRYRRRGGFIQLLNLIESSPPQKRENFLGLISQESKVWESEIRKRILSFDRLITWNPQYLSEIFTRIQPMNLAVAFNGINPEKSKTALSGLSPSVIKKIELENSERKPSPPEIFTCQIKVLEEARQLIKKGILKLDKVDPDLFIHEKIEEIIADQEVKQQIDNFSSSYSNPDLSIANNPSEGDTLNQSSASTKLSSENLGNSNDHERIFTDEDLKKVQDLSSNLQDRASKTNGEGKKDNDLFLKQLHQELLGIKNKIERLQKENNLIRRDLESSKQQEQKLKEDQAALKRENQSLKIELSNHKSKLEQIKKIA